MATLVYVGTHKSKDINYIYIIMNDEQNNGETLEIFDHYTGPNALWFHKPLGYCPVGGIATATVTNKEDGKRSIADFKYTGKVWNNQANRAEWQARTRTIEEEKRFESQAKSNKYKDIDDPIQLLRDTYHQLGTKHRAFFLAYIVGKITGSK